MKIMKVTQRKAPVTWERILYFIFGLFFTWMLLVGYIRLRD